MPIIFGSLDFQLGNQNRRKIIRGQKYVYIYRLTTKMRLTMLCLSGFELYSRWLPLTLHVTLIDSVRERAFD